MNAKRLWRVLAMVVLPLLLMVGFAAAADDAFVEQEPNDSFETATPITYPGEVNASFDDHDGVDFWDDIDYFSFRGEAGQLVFAEVSSGEVIALSVAIYDANRNLLARGYQEVSYLLPASGQYFIKVTGGNCGEGGLWCWGDYALILGGWPDNNEPNNTPEQASYVYYGLMHGFTDPATPCADHDYFSFYDHSSEPGKHIVIDVDAASIGSGLDAILRLYGPDGSLLAENDSFDGADPRLYYTLPVDGRYVIELAAVEGPDGCHDGFYRLKLDEVVHVSMKTGGKVGWLAYHKGDILTYYRYSRTWEMLFDASDVGLKSQVADFEILPEGDLLMVFGGPVQLPGLGWVRAQDVTLFDATSLEGTTAGTFLTYLDGSDVDLTTGNETIDALALSREGDLVISTRSIAKVGGSRLKTGKNDLLVFHATSLGADTAGTWEQFIKGPTADVPTSTNLISLWIEPYDPFYGDFNWYLTFDPGTTIDTVDIAPNDIAGLMCEDECLWWLELGLDAHGMTRKRIDGLSLGAAVNWPGWPTP